MMGPFADDEDALLAEIADLHRAIGGLRSTLDATRQALEIARRRIAELEDGEHPGCRCRQPEET